MAWLCSCVYSNVQTMFFFKPYMDVLCFHNISKMFYFGSIHKWKSQGLGRQDTPPPIWGFSLLKIWLKTMLCIVNNNVLYFNLNVHLNCVSSFTNGAKMHFKFRQILSLLHPCHRVFWSKCLLSSFTLPTHTSPVRENKINSCGTAVSKAIKAILFT